MLRSLSMIACGVLVGAVGMLALIRAETRTDVAGSGSESFSASVVELLRGDTDNAPQIPSVSDGLRVYQAASVSDPESTEASLAELARQADSPTRDLRIDAMLARLADLDASTAARLALDAGLDDRFVVRAFQYWAEADASAAMQGLRQIGGASTRRAAALGVLDVARDPADALERLSGILPASELTALRSGWIERRARENPYAALRDAQTIGDDDQRRAALQRVASVWSEQDPIGALSQADALPNELQAVYRNSVADTWARFDPVGFLSYLQGGLFEPDDVRGGFQRLVAADPLGALRVAESLPGTTGRDLRMIAVSELAAFDPATALAHVEAMPAGMDRSMMLQTVGSRYAQADPEGALEWALAQESASPNLLNSVIQIIAQSDAELATKLIADPPPGVDTRMMALMMGTLGVTRPEQAAVIADRLLGVDDPLSRETLSNLVSSWMRRDEEGALSWLTANLESLDAAAIGQAAQTMARRDPAAAARYVDRLPQHHRDAWIVQVAGPYANYDPVGAVSWLSQYQGTETYTIAYRQMVMQTAQNDPRAAADMLAQASPEVQRGAAARVASAWAQRDPRAAALWASEIVDVRARASAIGPAIELWAWQDESTARRWTLDLEAGEVRDSALSSLLTRMVRDGRVDRDVLDAFSSSARRNSALARSIPVLAVSDPARARDLLEHEVTDPGLRARIEQQLEGSIPAQATVPTLVF